MSICVIENNWSKTADRSLAEWAEDNAEDSDIQFCRSKYARAIGYPVAWMTSR